MLRLIKDGKGTRPLLCWEMQGSQAFAKRVQDELHYSPVYVRRDEDILGKPRDSKGRAGFNAMPKNILTILEEYRDLLYDQRIVNRSREAVDETLNFVYTSNSVEYRAKGKAGLQVRDSGAKLHHGDIVMADALAVKMLKEMGHGTADKSREKKIPEPGPSLYREWLSEKADRTVEEYEWA